ncbi:MAG: anthranilate phosphoribosyltransferase [Candidatus Margulisbacteria bacterium]|nr:anthranilate phosphoribosyltransferase [Candidatus Margulisiibacteriota bacterium]
MKHYLQRLNDKGELTEEESAAVLSEILKGTSSVEDIKLLLISLKEKGETVDEMVGFVKVLRSHMKPIHLHTDAMDVCGTGGSGNARFNVSSAAAFVLAAMGVPIAKHGNRGSKMANGSFDFLEALGIPIDVDPAISEVLFKKTGLCFLFARQYHPAMRFVGPARAQIKTRTIFNLLGPLCNPASVPIQVIGTTNHENAEKLALTFQRLGGKRAYIVVGSGGVDDVSIHGVSDIWEVGTSYISKSQFDPKSLGLKCGNPPVFGNRSEDNIDLFYKLLRNQDPQGTLHALVCLNAGVASACFGQAPSIEEGFIQAQKALKSGKVLDVFNTYKESANQLLR